jgi:hypothetical protein
VEARSITLLERPALEPPKPVELEFARDTYKKHDTKALFMLVKPNGAKLWRFKYAIAGVPKGISLGIYPDVSLKRAREKRDDARGD